MNVAVMSAAQRHGELVACLASESLGLDEAQVVSIAGTAAADQASLFGDKFAMRLIPNPARFGEDKCALVDLVMLRACGIAQGS